VIYIKITSYKENSGENALTFLFRAAGQWPAMIASGKGTGGNNQFSLARGKVMA